MKSPAGRAPGAPPEATKSLGGFFGEMVRLYDTARTYFNSDAGNSNGEIPKKNPFFNTISVSTFPF